MISDTEIFEDRIMDLEAIQEELKEQIDKIITELQMNEIDYLEDYEFQKGVK